MTSQPILLIKLFASLRQHLEIYRHSGHSVSEYLRSSLHDLFEHIVLTQIPYLAAYLKGYGGLLSPIP